MQNRSFDFQEAIYDNVRPYQSTNTFSINPCTLSSYDFMHYHSSMEIGICLCGKGVSVVEDKKFFFSEGDVCVIFPYQSHKTESLGNDLCQWCMLHIDLAYQIKNSELFNEKTLDLLFNNNNIGISGIISKDTFPNVIIAVKKFLDEVQCGNLPFNSELSSLFLYTIIFELKRADTESQNTQIPYVPQINSLKPAFQLLKNSINNNELPSVSMLSTECFMSQSSFRRIFKKATGVSPKEYILRYAIRQAQYLLLTTTLSITDISISIGFNDISVFNRNFIKFIGVSPSSFRKTYRPNSIDKEK